MFLSRFEQPRGARAATTTTNAARRALARVHTERDRVRASALMAGECAASRQTVTRLGRTGLLTSKCADARARARAHARPQSRVAAAVAARVRKHYL